MSYIGDPPAKTVVEDSYSPQTTPLPGTWTFGTGTGGGSASTGYISVIGETENAMAAREWAKAKDDLEVAAAAVRSAQDALKSAVELEAEAWRRLTGRRPNENKQIIGR